MMYLFCARVFCLLCVCARAEMAFFRCSTHYRRSTELARGQTLSLPRRPCLDLLGQQLVRQVLSVAKAAGLAQTPSINSVVGGEGEAVVLPSRHSDDAPPSEGLDLLGQQLTLLVAVAQLAFARKRIDWPREEKN